MVTTIATNAKRLKTLKRQGIHTETSTLTSRIIPELKPFGIESSPRKGYRIPKSKRPDQMLH